MSICRACKIKNNYDNNWIQHPFLDMREGEMVRAHVKIQFVSILSLPRGVVQRLGCQG